MLNARISVQFTARQTGTSDFGGPVYSPNIERVIEFSDGVAGGADIAWLDERTLAAGEEDDLDLAGVLTDAFGTVVDVVEVVALLVHASSGNGGAIVVGNAVSPVPLFSDPAATFSVPSGGWLFVAGKGGLFNVGEGTTDILRISNPGVVAASYVIAILGRV
jgi:hypothetical protein